MIQRSCIAEVGTAANSFPTASVSSIIVMKLYTTCVLRLCGVIVAFLCKAEIVQLQDCNTTNYQDFPYAPIKQQVSGVAYRRLKIIIKDIFILVTQLASTGQFYNSINDSVQDLT